MRACQTSHAQRAAVMIEPGGYFAALRSVIVAARHSILILGWDIDGQLSLTEGRPTLDGLPASLAELLVAVLEARPELQVFISTWDVSSLYAHTPERTSGNFDGAHPRLFFRRDARHSEAAAHHEKLVVIDDWLAFVGSVDLTTRRWSVASSELRSISRAAHAVQLCLQGPAARVLSVLAKERVLASNQTLPVAPENVALWPAELLPDATDLAAGIARTRAAHNDKPELREALAMTLSAIAHARRYLYIETQYLSSSEVVNALCTCLQTAGGPELVLILPAGEHGWLEQQIMLSLRNDALHLLHSHDREQRLRVYLASGQESLDSRLLIVDDELLKVGSSNLNNRSMALDSECDAWLEADTTTDASRGQQVRSVLMRVLAHHLGTDRGVLSETFARTGSLIKTIEAQASSSQHLAPVVPVERSQRPSFSALALDLEQPSPAEAFARYFAPRVPRRSVRRMALAAALLVAVALLATLLILGSNPSSAIRTTLAALLERVQDPQVGILYVLLAYGLGTLACAPITGMFIATTLALANSPLLGLVYALLGGQFAATLAYLIGRKFGSGPLQRLRGARLEQLRREVQTRSFRAVLIARFLPVGNFTLINVFLGSLKVPYLAFLAANAVGMAPSLLGLTLLSEQLREAYHQPSITSIGRLVLIAGGVLGAMATLSRFFSKRRAQRAQAERDNPPAAEESVLP